MDVEDFRAVRKVAEEAGRRGVDLDGARIFNASAASGVDVAEYAAEVDTLMFCVSKGLGAPIGSLVCGSAEQMRGGSPDPRSCSVGPGGRPGSSRPPDSVVLEEGPQRLHEDHEPGHVVWGEAVEKIVPGSLDPADVETNMVFADTVESKATWLRSRSASRFEDDGVWVSAGGLGRLFHFIETTMQQHAEHLALFDAQAEDLGGARQEARHPGTPRSSMRRCRRWLTRPV